jgi:uncharacterized protein (TIGR00251 family)
MNSIRIHLKVVPGSRKEGIAGVLGDRLKIRVGAPAEDGRANQAVCEVLAERLGVRERDIVLIAGHRSTEKTVRVVGVTVEQVMERIERV